MEFRPQLVNLLDYTARMATLGERAVFRLAEYRGLVFHQYELQNRIGITHDLAEGEERSWLKIERLPRRDPPGVPEEVGDWMAVGRDPFKEPTVQTVRIITIPRQESEALVARGVAKPEDIEPTARKGRAASAEDRCDVVLRLENDPDSEAKIKAYLEGPWTTWAEEEKPRRETIHIYEEFFSLQQAIEVQGLERPLEIVWGVGLSRWKHPKQEIDHPLIEQLVEIDVDRLDGAIRLRPRSTEPTLSIKAYHELGVEGADILQRVARDHFKQLVLDNEFSPFSKLSFEPLLRQACTLLDVEGSYYSDHVTDIDESRLPEGGPSLVITDTWTIYARPRSANIVMQDIERLKQSVSESEPEQLPGVARRLVTAPDNTVGDISFLPEKLGTGLERKLRDTKTNLGEESEFYFPKPFNDEQVKTSKRLSREDGVVVQGPPGTCKTHTIANIICHYMATGRRVLVVSHGESALSVLRDLPLNFHPAAIRASAVDTPFGAV